MRAGLMHELRGVLRDEFHHKRRRNDAKDVRSGVDA